MGKRVSSVKLKGELDINLNDGSIFITSIVKGVETTYDLAEVLESYNGKEISVSIAEDVELEPVTE